MFQQFHKLDNTTNSGRIYRYDLPGLFAIG